MHFRFFAAAQSAQYLAIDSVATSAPNHVRAAALGYSYPPVPSSLAQAITQHPAYESSLTSGHTRTFQQGNSVKRSGPLVEVRRRQVFDVDILLWWTGGDGRSHDARPQNGSGGDSTPRGKHLSP